MTALTPQVKKKIAWEEKKSAADTAAYDKQLEREDRELKQRIARSY